MVTQSEGVRGNFALVGECPLFLAPLDSDLLTMSAPFAFRDAVVHGDRTGLFHVAQGIMQLQVRTSDAYSDPSLDWGWISAPAFTESPFRSKLQVLFC